MYVFTRIFIILSDIFVNISSKHLWHYSASNNEEMLTYTYIYKTINIEKTAVRKVLLTI